MSAFLNSNLCCFSPDLEKISETNKERDISKRNKSTRTLSNAQGLSFLDQMYPEPWLLQIESERLRLNRPFVQADRDPANLGMGFAPSVLRQRGAERATAFVSISSTRPFKPNWDKSDGSLTLFDVPLKT